MKHSNGTAKPAGAEAPGEPPPQSGYSIPHGMAGGRLAVSTPRARSAMDCPATARFAPGMQNRRPGSLARNARNAMNSVAWQGVFLNVAQYCWREYSMTVRRVRWKCQISALRSCKRVSQRRTWSRAMNVIQAAKIRRVPVHLPQTFQSESLSKRALRTQRKQDATLHEQVPDTHYYYG